jgi:hypothetical protein
MYVYEVKVLLNEEQQAVLVRKAFETIEADGGVTPEALMREMFATLSAEQLENILVGFKTDITLDPQKAKEFDQQQA